MTQPTGLSRKAKSYSYRHPLGSCFLIKHCETSKLRHLTTSLLNFTIEIQMTSNVSSNSSKAGNSSNPNNADSFDRGGGSYMVPCPTSHCLAAFPTEKELPGRLSKSTERDIAQKHQPCGNCEAMGHNIKRCPGLPGTTALAGVMQEEIEPSASPVEWVDTGTNQTTDTAYLFAVG